MTEVWSYGGPGDEQFYANFLSDADWMPETGNILGTFGGLVSDGHNWARIVEVTHDMPAEKVFEMFIDAEAPEGWSIFRTITQPLPVDPSGPGKLSSQSEEAIQGFDFGIPPDTGRRPSISAMDMPPEAQQPGFR